MSRAAADLGQAANTFADLAAATRGLPERLARAQLLHMPKGRMTVVDLNRRLLTKHASVYEVEDLGRAWGHVGTTARDVAAQLNRALGTRFDHPMQTLEPIERTI